MKFGQNLPRNQVPEWADSYIDYKALKKIIKVAQKETVNEGDADVAGFFFTLDRQLEDVDTFYNRKYAECSRRLRLLYDRYGMASKLKDGMDKDAMEDLMGTLLELRGQYRKLQWYGEVNRRGFVKITKKLDKKIPSSAAQTRYIATKVDPKAFATNNKLTLDMRAINDWMSSLGDVKIRDEDSSVYSGGSGSLHRATSTSALKLPSFQLDALDHAIREDHAISLSGQLSKNKIDPMEDAHRKLLLDLLQRSIHYKAADCIQLLLALLPSINEEDDINKRNCIHRLVISIGRSRALEHSSNGATLTDFSKNATYITAAEAPIKAAGTYKVHERDPTSTLGHEEPAVKLLKLILQHLTVAQRSAIVSKDAYGRMPLHYTAQYGLVAATQILLKCIEDWAVLGPEEDAHISAWQDVDGYTPLHLSVTEGHYRTTKVLLFIEDPDVETAFKHISRKQIENSGVCLTMATKSNFFKIVKLLVDAGVDVNYQDQQGETALHIAARFGYRECAEALLNASKGPEKCNVELAEKTYGWTALFTASVDGHLPIVELLMQHGAEAKKPDLSGWTPKEHAALRGHLEIAQYLVGYTPAPSANTPLQAASETDGQPKTSSLGDRRSKGVSKEAVNANARVPEPVKSFGHRYLRDQAMVLVSLGSMDNRKMVEAVNLEQIALSEAHSTQLDTALSIVVSAQNASGEPTIIDLPIQENISTSPITFYTKDPAKVKLLFDLVPTYSGSTTKVIGRGVAMLSSIRPNLGTMRISLQGDLTVPLVAADTLNVIGSVNFNFLIITPFSHPNMSITEEQTYWKRTSTLVIGHRGLGKNMATKKSLQLGENTIDSFVMAANLGAQYVEFDVQLTKDHVPVIYHDFLVSETGIDAPVHTLTLEQFLHINDSSARQSRPESPTNNMEKLDKYPERRVQRSFSLGAPDSVSRNMQERMKHTRDFKKKGFKGNSRGNFIQSPFTTLEEMFKKVPSEVGFNIEMKYPMLFETEDEGMDTYAVELNQFVDTVLAQVYGLGAKRNIIFSSFNPDICLLLSFKQPSIPILFLTDAGTAAVGDIRASSLQEAVRFASRWNLLGVVSASEPLILCPRLVKVVKESGLVCVSYGTQNNDPQNVRLQAREGIDAVIVDSVLAVRKGLTDEEHENGVNGAVAEKVSNGDSAEAFEGLTIDVDGAVQANGEVLSNGDVAPTEDVVQTA